MSSNIVRSRIVPNLSKIYKKYNNNCGRRDFSSDVVSGAPKKEPIIASQSIVGDLTAPPEVAAEEAASQDAGRKSPWRFLKYGIVATLTGVTAGAGYVTYGKVIFFFFFHFPLAFWKCSLEARFCQMKEDK